MRAGEGFDRRAVGGVLAGFRRRGVLLAEDDREVGAVEDGIGEEPRRLGRRGIGVDRRQPLARLEAGDERREIARGAEQDEFVAAVGADQRIDRVHRHVHVGGATRIGADIDDVETGRREAVALLAERVRPGVGALGHQAPAAPLGAEEVAALDRRHPRRGAVGQPGISRPAGQTAMEAFIVDEQRALNGLGHTHP